MNNVLTSPVGIDQVIQKVQTSLYTYLTGRWSGTIDGFGKAYKNKQKEGDTEILEWYNSAQNDYQDVYFDDKSDAVFFFIEGDSDDSEDEIVFVSSVKCVFMVDLSKILPSATGRADAEAHRDAVEALRSSSLRFTVTGIQKGIDTVFSGIDTEKIKFNDIHPLHCFAVTMSLNYYLTDKCP